MQPVRSEKREMHRTVWGFDNPDCFCQATSSNHHHKRSSDTWTSAALTIGGFCTNDGAPRDTSNIISCGPGEAMTTVPPLMSIACNLCGSCAMQNHKLTSLRCKPEIGRET